MSIARLLFVCSLLMLPVALCLSTAAPARAQDKPAGKEQDPKLRKLEKVRELMVSMKTREIAERTMSSTMESMGLPKEYCQKFKDAFDFEGMIESTVEVYAKHLEEEDIDAIAAFYKTESGKHIAAAMPEIMVESMQAGQEFGKRAAEAIGSGK